MLYQRFLRREWNDRAAEGWRMTGDPWWLDSVGDWDAWFVKEGT